MTLNKIRISVTADDDRHFEGYTVEAFNTVTKAKRTWRADVTPSRPDHFLWYRMDLKPTKRTHELVEAYGVSSDASVLDKWIDNRAESLAQGVI